MDVSKTASEEPAEDILRSANAELLASSDFVRAGPPSECDQTVVRMWGGLEAMCPCWRSGSLRPICLRQLGTLEVYSIAAGLRHVLILTAGGKVWAVGNGRSGQLGVGRTQLFTPSPRLVGHSLEQKVVSQISAGDEQSAALTVNGELYVWGGGESCGMTSSENLFFPRPSPLGDEKCVAAVCKFGLTLAATDNVLWGWGPNVGGHPLRLPERIFNLPAGGMVRQLDATKFACFILFDDGSLMAFGDSTYGEIPGRLREPGRHFGAAIRGFDVKGVPLVTADGEMLRPMKLSAGDRHVLMITRDGRLYSWGENTCGQCGVPGGQAILWSLELVKVAIGERYMRVVDVSAGGRHSSCISSEGLIFLWGHAGEQKLVSSGEEQYLTETKSGVVAGQMGLARLSGVDNRVTQPEPVISLTPSRVVAVGLNSSATVVVCRDMKRKEYSRIKADVFADPPDAHDNIIDDDDESYN